MRPVLTILSDTSAAGGLAIGLSQIYTLLGIVLTVGSIIVLIVNFALRMYDRFKDKKITKQEAKDTFDDMVKMAAEIVRLKDELEKYQDNNNGKTDE